MSDFLARARACLPSSAPEGAHEVLGTFFGDSTTDPDLDVPDPQSAARIASTHCALRESLDPKASPLARALKIATPDLEEPERARRKDPPQDWFSNHTVIDIVGKDMSFLVDSVSAEINAQGFLIDTLFHPVLDETSHIHIRLQNLVAPDRLASLETGLQVVLEDVALANRDWPAMLARMGDILSVETAPESRELKAFLTYLHEGHFTFLGHKAFHHTLETDGTIHSRAVKGSGLGVFSRDRRTPFLSDPREMIPEYPQTRDDNPVRVSKTLRNATVHRAVPMDVVSVRGFDPSGHGVREDVFLGLFTSTTYSRSISDVPLLREKVADVIAQTGAIKGSHNMRALRYILEKYPRDEMFQMDSVTLKAIALGILRLQEHQKIALYTRSDPLGRTMSCLVYVPRERYDTRIRLRFQRILEEALGGTCARFSTTLDDALFARVLYSFHPDPERMRTFDRKAVQARLRLAGRSWGERLCESLRSRLRDDGRALALGGAYAHAFPVNYRERFSPGEGVSDILKLSAAQESGAFALDLYHPEGLDAHHVRLKIYHPKTAIVLSDILPLLENMGLRVLSELPFEVRPAGSGHAMWIHDFLMESETPDTRILIRDVKTVFESALFRVVSGDMENDGLNRLVLGAQMGWRDIMILRAYTRYLHQIRYPFTPAYIEKALTDYPQISKSLVGLFKAYHDPVLGSAAHAGTPDEGHSARESAAAGHAVAIDHALESVESLDQDRILRTLTGLIEATLRTNWFQPDEQGNPKPCLAIKIDSRTAPELPEPRPFREIFVYAPRVEGIHLRGDKTARGGIRWSDRPEDFRTEILGLMKAQQVKNAAIVPMGAKGGFVVKSPPRTGGRSALLEEGIVCYRIFIGGLLDLTDNQVTGASGDMRIVAPPAVVRRDGDDPYLVVAADKGTARFSDIANTLSHHYGFWLGDAFASGGSTGYDHKAMGITARGAWESVKRHFRECGHDTQTTPFDVVGVGDMAGDVFGNGMLLSRQIRLIGAFNHVHIFCDPDPDPAQSFEERARLFAEVRGWEAYDPARLSKGGRIFSRADKSLALTPEIMERFEIDRARVTPHELIRAMLRTKVDLLWFGGIGTYVKAASETHADVGDKANDPLRINATELRARVIGEGANLALTQLGRVSFALAGGRINTDFIDNSAGVSTSDAEVNIKILLNAVMADRTHKLSMGTRNRLLESMTEDVAAQILQSAYQQAQALSLAEANAPADLRIHAEFISDLEREIGLDRMLEGLPDEETILARRRAGKGLTRPELSVLSAYAKITFTRDLLSSDIPDSPEMTGLLVNYFPAPLRQKYETAIRTHRLRREIITTRIASGLVNRMGATFVKSRMIRTGADCATVARAWIIVREAFGLRALWEAIESLDCCVPAHIQIGSMQEIAELSGRAVDWFLTRAGWEPDIVRDIAAYRQGIAELKAALPGLLQDDLAVPVQARRDHALSSGLPADLADELSLIPALGSVCDIIRASLEHKQDIVRVAQVYFDLGEIFSFEWLRARTRAVVPEDRWSAEARAGLESRLYQCQAGLALSVLCAAPRDVPVELAAGQFCADHSARVSRTRTLIEDVRAGDSHDLAALMVAEHALRALYEG